MEFDFISDEKFRTILIRDSKELSACLDANAYKAVLVLSGSIIEAILLEYFISFPQKGLTEKKILSMDLSTLISHAHTHGIISESVKDLSTVLKGYRNLIHPCREIRKGENFDRDTAIVTKSLLNMVVKEIREQYLSQVGYKAHDIMAKLENDSVSTSIFVRLIEKINKSEKSKLYVHLVEYKLKSKQGRLSDYDLHRYISALKPYIERNLIQEQLKKLIAKIETGKRWEVMTYFEMLYDDLNILSKDSIELIMLYVMNVLGSPSLKVENRNDYVSLNLFAALGPYLVSAEVEEELFILAAKLVQLPIPPDGYDTFRAYDQLVNSFAPDKRDEIKKYVLKHVPAFKSLPFYQGYMDGYFDLPF